MRGSMFASVGNMDIYRDDFPLFLTFVLRTEFDPARQFESFPSHVYNELPNDLFQVYLHDMARAELATSKLSLPATPSELRTVSVEQAKETMKKQGIDLIQTILRPFLSSRLHRKWNYALRDFHVFEAKQSQQDRHLFVLRVKLCLHKEECAYGKVVHDDILLHVKQKRDRHTNLRLDGIVPQQNIQRDFMFLEV